MDGVFDNGNKWMQKKENDTVNIDDMKSLIQEWMAQELSAVDLAKTYAEIRTELDIQLEYCMESYIDGRIENER